MDNHAPLGCRQRKSFLPARGLGKPELDVALAKPQVSGFYDKPTGAIQYVVADQATKRCAIIDPILDFDEKSGATATKNADALLDFVSEQRAGASSGSSTPIRMPTISRRHII